MGVNVDQVESSRVDHATLRADFLKSNYSPDKYANSDHHLGRARAIWGCFQYVKSIYGYAYAKSVLRRIDMEPAHVALLHERGDLVSPRMGEDLLSLLSLDGLDVQHFFEIGASMPKINCNSPIARSLAATASPKELYRDVFDKYSELWDVAFRYRIDQLDDDGCVATISPSFDVYDRLRSPLIGNKHVCRFKKGNFSSLLKYRQTTSARILESECLYEGGRYCRYHVAW